MRYPRKERIGQGPHEESPNFVFGMKRYLLAVFLWLLAAPAYSWTNGDLLIWMDAERGWSLEAISQKFKDQFGINVWIETPENITDSFPAAAQAGKGPDIVIWAHDKVGEWADAGLISPINLPDQFRAKYYAKAWEAVRHNSQIWGFPIGLETVALIYNKKLLDGPPPKSLADLSDLIETIKLRHPGVFGILWDYKSAYYSWGILASAGAYIFAKNKGGYDLKDIGVDNAGAVEGLSKIMALVDSGILPKSVSYSTSEELMSQGKLAMMISGPWAWANLMKSGIDFGIAPVPGCGGSPAKPFVGVLACYINRASPNQDIAKEFIENFLLSEEGFKAMDEAKPIGIPSLVTLANEMERTNPLLQQLQLCAEQGEIMPNIPEMGRFWSAVGSALQTATNKQTSIPQALQEAADSMRRQ